MTKALPAALEGGNAVLFMRPMCQRRVYWLWRGASPNLGLGPPKTSQLFQSREQIVKEHLLYLFTLLIMGTTAFGFWNTLTEERFSYYFLDALTL